MKWSKSEQIYQIRVQSRKEQSEGTVFIEWKDTTRNEDRNGGSACPAGLGCYPDRQEGRHWGCWPQNQAAVAQAWNSVCIYMSNSSSGIL